MNKEEKIKELLAEIKALKEETTKYKEQKAYGLVWENEKNKEKIVEDCKKKLPILERVKDKEIITDKTQPMNLMIEGDNYHALTCLNYTHRGKIDVIYIDPPYNTGAKDWKYNNNYVDKEDRFRHSKWLNMMYNRLSIAKDLLSEKGFLIVAIDHYELFNIGLLCDYIFEEKNRLGVISVEHNPQGRTFSKYLSTTNEYYLIFAKNLSKCQINNLTIEGDELKKYPDKDEKSFYKKIYLRKTGFASRRTDRPTQFFPFYYDTKNKLLSLDETLNSIKILPINSKGEEFVWRISASNCKKLLINNDIGIEKNSNNHFTLYKKQRLEHGKKPTTVWKDARYNAASHGAVLLKSMLKDVLFDFPKSLYAVLDSLKITSQKNSTILDFFAGSGTTGHAVMELNKEDGGDRQFILCTNNENNNGNGQGGIAEAVCYPRIKKVIKGYNKNGDGEWVAGLGGNLHYFKADENSFISIEMLKNISDEKRLELTLKAGELIVIRENIFDEKEHSKYYQIFEDDSKQVAIYFKEEHTKLNELVEKLDNTKEKIVYLFSWGKNLLTGDDLGYPDITVKDIPEPIIRIYQEING